MPSLPRADERRRMVDQQIAARGVCDSRVLSAMRDVPRHLFIPPPYDRSAYEDCPLPIGNGQTISQPYIVALMTELLKPASSDHVLEIGAGCGYQAAVLSVLVRKVTTIERIPAVADITRNNLAAYHYDNVELIVGDGTLGYPKNAPYNGIIITASAPDIPSPLIDQLNENGRLVAPVGSRDIQELVVLEKHKDTITKGRHGGVRFVPLIGEYGWK
ncbi:MAG: protein-L-isoaspartate(D-aspartate) O-methyltransferase [Methanoregula sp.]|nr:protein-L-isoaspartate(D-aspartate) O-methyltransferase [Methanoregula sp.]